MEQFLIAHDLGTSGDKATLFTAGGELVRSYTASYDVNFFNGNYAEQDPENWWDAVCEATKAVLEGEDPHRVAAMSFSAQMQGCLPVDKNGVPLRNSMIWRIREQLRKQSIWKRSWAQTRFTGLRVTESAQVTVLRS